MFLEVRILWFFDFGSGVRKKNLIRLSGSLCLMILMLWVIFFVVLFGKFRM